MVLADRGRGRGFVQVVAADIADLLVELRHFDFCLLQIADMLGFATHRPWVTSKTRLLLFKAVDRIDDRAIG